MNQSNHRETAGPQLLVSVRSAEEALAALSGGADLIDVKEPKRGSLGRADDVVIAAVRRAVGTRRPVSAALGEWADGPGAIPAVDLTYVKWGLAGCRRITDWRDRWEHWRRRPQRVLVAYADWQCAQAPPIGDVFALACEHPGSVMLIDTHCKDSAKGIRRPTLLDWLPIPDIEALCARAREFSVKIALAGSLSLAEIEALMPAKPTWFAVRGAACEFNDREADVCADKVRQLADMLFAGRAGDG
ncbi:MAG: hypothetical protein HYR84_13055 [Planctomycetes bacterium]|nr:hypothetical protein [Planctomycetota bacterium]